MGEPRRTVGFTNGWMFNLVMMDESICREVIEAVLGITVERIDYLNAEQVVDPAPENRGIRMDVYAKESGSSERMCADVPELWLGDDSHWLALNAQAWESAEDERVLDLLRYARTGKAVGSLSSRIDKVVERANEDRKWVDKVWSVSTIEENTIRRERIYARMACAEAREEGREEGVAQFAALASRLVELGRPDDVRRAAEDAPFREQLLREFAEGDLR